MDRLVLFLVPFILFTPFLAIQQETQQEVTPIGQGIASCQAVKQSVYLTSDLNTKTHCLEVVASDIVLNCAGHSITGPGVTNMGQGIDVSIGVYGHGVSNITVANCTFSGLDYSVLFEDSSNIILSNNSVENFFQSGFYISGAGIVALFQNTVGQGSQEAFGIVLDGELQSTIGTTVLHHLKGLYVKGRSVAKLKRFFPRDRIEVEDEATLQEELDIESEGQKQVNETNETRETNASDITTLISLPNSSIEVMRGLANESLNATENSSNESIEPSTGNYTNTTIEDATPQPQEQANSSINATSDAIAIVGNETQTNATNSTDPSPANYTNATSGLNESGGNQTQ